MAQFKVTENCPLTDFKKITNYNPGAVITEQPPLLLDDKNAKGETFNTWLLRMNTEIYQRYDATMDSMISSRMGDNFDKLELKNMFYRNVESPEFYKIIKEFSTKTNDENNNY